MNATTLPILDLARYADPAEKSAFLTDLRHAARDIGFFYLINHGVDDQLQHSVQQLSRRFFSLADAQKQPVAMIHSPHFRGYNRAASELTRGQPDWREQFDIGAERPALTLGDDAPRWQRLQGPNLWPDALPELKPTLLSWQSAMTQVGITVLRAFAEALNLPNDAFDTLYGQQPNEHIKLIRYPGQQETQSSQGVGAHKDSGFLGFLLQDEGCRLKSRPAAGSMRPRWPAASWSILANCLSWRPMAICARRCIASFRRRRTSSASLSPSSSARSSTPWFRSTPCRLNWRRRRSGRIAIRRIRCCGRWAGTT